MALRRRLQSVLCESPTLALNCRRRWLGTDAPGDVDDDVTLTLLSERSMMFQDSEVEMQDRVGALETTVDNAVDHGLPPECAKILRDIVFRTNFELGGGVESAYMAHEPLEYLRGPSRGLHKQWTAVKKEGFGIVSTLKWLPYLL